MFVGLLFYVTSADSGALVMANLSSKLRTAQDDASAWLRILWAATTGLLTIAVLAVGGIYALQYATVIFGLPFAFVVLLVMFGLLKALRVEGRRVESRTHALPTMLSARGGHGGDDQLGATWKARLARVTNFVDVASAQSYQGQVVKPALSDVAFELSGDKVSARVTEGVAADGEDEGLPYVELRTAAEKHPFVYRVQVSESAVPAYGGRMVGDHNKYARLEVHSGDGGQDYDVMGYTGSQLIHDCLDQYERHLEFLRRV